MQYDKHRQMEELDWSLLPDAKMPTHTYDALKEKRVLRRMKDSSRSQDCKNSPGNAALFEEQGFAMVDMLLSEDECREVEVEVGRLLPFSVGTRNLLDAPWCARLAREIRARLHELLPSGHLAFQCTLFEKSAQSNWLVSSHQDLSIPVRERVDHPELFAWSEKEGVLYVQPPADILEQLIAVRFHVDHCGDADGPLKIVPGSHRFGRLSQAKALEIRYLRGERECHVARGGALIMWPLLLHASSKSSGQGKRRVLHFIYGPPSLPFALAWRHAV